jgi:hypothetical protein
MSINSEINEHNSTDTIPGPSSVNATSFFTDGSTADQKSLKTRVVLRSTNSNLSPVVDSSRLSLIAVANRVDSWNPAELESLTSDSLIVSPTTVTPAVSNTANKYTFTDNTGTFYTTDADLAQHMSKLDVGKYLTITNCATAGHNVATPKRIISVTYTPSASNKCTVVLDHTFTAGSSDTGASINVVQLDRFISELAPSAGSASAKYVTKRLVLARPCSALKIMFPAYRDENSEILTYYKILKSDDSRNFDDIEYQLAPYNVDVNGVLTELTPQSSTSSTDYAYYESTINGLPEFIAVAVKIVMKSTNPARAPKIRDLQIIALED